MNVEVRGLQQLPQGPRNVVGKVNESVAGQLAIRG